MFNIPGELLGSGSPLGALLDLKRLFVLKEKIDGSRWGGFPGSSRLKQNSQLTDSMRGCDYTGVSVHQLRELCVDFVSTNTQGQFLVCN